MFEGKGVIVYDPNRQSMKRRINNWCVIEVDREITRYFRWWVRKELWLDLSQPSWDAHCSCVRGETIPLAYQNLWKKYDREIAVFHYDNNVRFSGDTTFDRPSNFWFVDVYCPKIDQIRSELGLKVFGKYHLTIGRTY